MARRWVESRSAGVPPALAVRIADAAAVTTAAAELPRALVDASVACLRSAVDLGDDRAAALDLLAADALLTLACDAALERGSALGELWRLSAEKLALLLAEPDA